VGNCEGDILGAEFGGEFAGYTTEPQHRLAAGLIGNFDVAPADSVTPAGAQRFHCGFFHREAAGIALELIFVALAIGDFRGREEALEEGLAVALDGRLNAIDLCDIQSQADDHACSHRIGEPRSTFLADYTYNWEVKTRSATRGTPRLRNEKNSAVAQKPAPVNGAKHWSQRRANGIVVIEALPLVRQKWLTHGFSTRAGGASRLVDLYAPSKPAEAVLNLGFSEWDERPRVEQNRRRFQKTLGAETMTLVALSQIHSDIIHVIDALPEQPLQGDALVTATPGLLIAVQTADCIPILLADPEHRLVAAIHAGWRGTLKRIAEKTVGRMRMLFGTRPEKIIAASGPGIGRCCYEVGPEVAKEFGSQFENAREWFDGPYDALAAGEDPNPLPWLTMMPPGHQPPPPSVQLDLQAANRSILKNAGVAAKNISVSDLCTSCRTDLLFSYRREKTTGRLMAAIGIK
jgi:YfiH family protein